MLKRGLNYDIYLANGVIDNCLMKLRQTINNKGSKEVLKQELASLN